MVCRGSGNSDLCATQEEMVTLNMFYARQSENS